MSAIDVRALAATTLDQGLYFGTGRIWRCTQDELERFAAIVLEEAAKLCDRKAMQNEWERLSGFECGNV